MEIKCYCGHTITCDCGPLEEPKQETLEEASWKYNPLKKLDGEFIRHAFKQGAKWQAERMYSEEELINFAHFYTLEEFNSTMQNSKSANDILQEWSEQCKKNKGGEQ